MLFPELDPAGKIQTVANEGFRNIEFWSWRDKNLESVAEACEKTGTRVVNFSGQRKGDLIASAAHGELIADLEGTIPVARNLDCPYLMILSNELGDGGRVVNRHEELSPEEKHGNAVAGLRSSVSALPANVRLVLEVLNTRLDHPGYYLDSMQAASALVTEVDHPQLSILCDLYHMGMMGHDLPPLIERYADRIGYIHIADVPGRHEPGTGAVNWEDVFAALRASGYDGYIGFEYSPAADSTASLRSIRSLWERVVGSF